MYIVSAHPPFKVGWLDLKICQYFVVTIFFFFHERLWFVPQIIGMKLSEMRKYMKKTKDSVSSPLYKVWRKFFRKNALHGEKTFYMGTNVQIMQRGNLMVKRFQRSSQVSFFLIDPDLSYWYIISKGNITNRGLNLKNTFCMLCF